MSYHGCSGGGSSRAVHGPLAPNYRYVLEQATDLARGGRVLDYGCGSGDVVAAGRSRGLDILGVDTFYAGSRAQEIAAREGLLGSSVFAMEAGRIPFPAASFDVVVSNQVFEHVEDIDGALSEIARVLRPDGALLALFPTSEVIREGHCGVPCVHWFRRDSRLRYPYMRAMRALGFGRFKAGKTHRQWSIDFLKWLDSFTRYRRIPELQAAMTRAGFAVQHEEAHYIRFRLGLRGVTLPEPIARSRHWKGIAAHACRRLGGVVVLARKPPAPAG